MAESISDAAPSIARPVYAASEKPKIKRVAVAIFFCGLAASIGVALISAAVIFLYSVITELIAPGLGSILNSNSDGLGFGLAIAVLGGAFNWYFFYLTVPAAWLALGLSIGRFPRRGISDAAPYYRWGAIWGAVLVSSVTTIAAALIAGSDASMERAGLAGLGGFLGGALIGALGGLGCAVLFRLIVRPARQLESADAEVFA